MADAYFAAARRLLSRIGRPAGSLWEIPGGSNHYVFGADCENGDRLIVKFPRLRETEKGYQQAGCDTLFGSHLSPERERWLLGLILSSGLPAPRVIGVYDTDMGAAMVMTRSPGADLPRYMTLKGHSLAAFLQIMTALGEDFRRLHGVRLPSFGSLMADGVISPAGLHNFADFYRPVNDRILAVCRAKGSLSKEESEEVSAFFDDAFSRLAPLMRGVAVPVMTDMHGGNFFAENGRVSGYFDVESTLSAPAMFELYALRFFVFNFYSEHEFSLAEAAFWRAYTGGARSFAEDNENALLEFFSACRLLELCQSYHGVRDGLRDNWSDKIKKLLFSYIKSGRVDYAVLGDLWRARDGQPSRPLIS